MHQAGVALSGPLFAGQVRVPPAIAFYRVPRTHCAAVEAAIQACGKWTR
jgi:hypothetical protein